MFGEWRTGAARTRSGPARRDPSRPQLRGTFSVARPLGAVDASCFGQERRSTGPPGRALTRDRTWAWSSKRLSVRPRTDAGRSIEKLPLASASSPTAAPRPSLRAWRRPSARSRSRRGTVSGSDLVSGPAPSWMFSSELSSLRTAHWSQRPAVGRRALGDADADDHRIVRGLVRCREERGVLPFAFEGLERVQKSRSCVRVITNAPWTGFPAASVILPVSS